MSEKSKICNQCGEDKEFCDFPGDTSKRDGCRSTCKLCYNTSRRKNKTKKEKYGLDDVENKPLSSEIDILSKDFKDIHNEIFNKSLTPQMAKKNQEIIRDLWKKLENIAEKLSNPPTNEFTICECMLKSRSDTRNNIFNIRSSLCLFLVQKKGLFNMDGNIIIKKNEKYTRDRLLDIILPENILLTIEEIDEFLNIMYTTEDNEQNISEFTVNVEGSKECARIYELCEIIIKFSLDGGYILTEKDVTYSYYNDTWTFILPDNIKFSSADIKKLESEISKYMVDRIIECS